MILFGTGLAWLGSIVYRDERERDDQWDEEVKRQQRVKDLYPDQPSYEERMGTHYGNKDDDNG